MQNLCTLKCLINIFIGTIKTYGLRRMPKIKHLWPIPEWLQKYEIIWMRHVKTVCVILTQPFFFFLIVLQIHNYNKQYQTAVMGNILEASDPEAAILDDSQVKWVSFPSLLLAFLFPSNAKWIKGLFVEIFLMFIVFSVNQCNSGWGIKEMNSIQIQKNIILTLLAYQELIKDKLAHKTSLLCHALLWIWYSVLGRFFGASVLCMWVSWIWQ